mmetsp:Transcript_36737/g.121768  ORF Transcript_36737/g.121768 Transcript_36737/m.121768 type:complete len:371 (-) Transcript_36737:30-1142(-)
MSTALPLVLHRPHDCVVNLELVRKVQLLKREREGRVGAAHARDRCLEVVKTRVLDGGGNLGAKAGGEWRLVRHQQAARLLDRVADRVHVPRRNRLQVDDLARHALCRRPLARARHRVHLCPPRDASDVLSGREDLRLPERQHVVAGGHVADRGAVQDLRLEEEARVAIADAGEQQPLGGVRIARVHDLEAGRVRKVGLGRLRVVVPAMPHRLRRRTDRQPAAVELGARAVPELSSLVANLVHRREDVVGELDLGDGGATHRGQPDPKSHEPLLVDRHVEHPLLPKLVAQAHRAAEDAAKGDVLTKDDGRLVGLQRYPEGVVDCGDHGELFGLRLLLRRIRRGGRKRPRSSAQARSRDATELPSGTAWQTG